MTQDEIDSMANWLEDVSRWMKESSQRDKGVTIEDLVDDPGNTCEVVVDIHLMNDEVIRLRNYCYDSFMHGSYLGDDMNLLPAHLEINKRQGDILHQMFIPISSICHIDSFNKGLNWRKYAQRAKDLLKQQ